MLAFSADGFALSDVLTELARLVAVLSGMPAEARAALLDKLSDVEYRLAFGTSERLQAAALVGAFEQCRATLTQIRAAAAAAGGGGSATTGAGGR